MESKKYPIGGYAPGNYSCTCCKCGTEFSGDKRAVECEQCAVAAKEKFDALSPDEQAEVIKRNIEEVNKAFSDWTKKPDVNLAIVGHGKPALYYPGSYYQPLFDLLHQEHGITPLESEMTDIIFVVEKMRGKQPEPKWVKGALQWAKETIDFAWDYVKVPESLVETWGNMYMNTMHAIQQAQQEIEQPAAGREEDAWTDINDRLPEEGGRYWCYVESLTDLGFSYFQWNCDYNPQLRRFSDMTLTKGERITHWRRLPEPPKKG